ncbi:hypothetical protein ACJX0J_007090, partial [Zea mays]
MTILQIPGGSSEGAKGGGLLAVLQSLPCNLKAWNKYTGTTKIIKTSILGALTLSWSKMSASIVGDIGSVGIWMNEKEINCEYCLSPEASLLKQAGHLIALKRIQPRAQSNTEIHSPACFSNDKAENGDMLKGKMDMQVFNNSKVQQIVEDYWQPCNLKAWNKYTGTTKIIKTSILGALTLSWSKMSASIVGDIGSVGIWMNEKEIKFLSPEASLLKQAGHLIALKRIQPRAQSNTEIHSPACFSNDKAENGDMLKGKMDMQVFVITKKIENKYWHVPTSQLL